MKISKDTLDVLKNYSTINQGITVNAGNELKTMSIDQSVDSLFKSDTIFPTEFSIYDVNGFLSVISIFEDPDFNFQENNLVISEGAETVTDL